mgnify:CR=1 FL=1
MKTGKQKHNLHSCVNNAKEKRNKETCKILVCGGTGCLAGGSDKIFDRFSELTAGMIMLRSESEQRLHMENMSALRKVDVMAFARWVRLSELNLIIIST